ncbi:hypothetical protein NDU88_005419 [Pleurodeles waltl]|uniref:Uncharacterized protein n=1 Tax=Pleurodeles waltl TaxID=8319 RepID=A0AAV7SLL6_PLEWA|nr:hypothetical protein NDU88_005419 [Pleurodeles waltl]
MRRGLSRLPGASTPHSSPYTPVGDAKKEIKHTPARDRELLDPAIKRTAYPMAARAFDDAETLSDHVTTQVRPEGKDSIDQFFCKPATEGPEWGKEHVRMHATEEEADVQSIKVGQTPAYGTISVEISTGGIIALRSLSCPATITADQESSAFTFSHPQVGSAPSPPLNSDLPAIADYASQHLNTLVACSPPGIGSSRLLNKAISTSADTVAQHSNTLVVCSPGVGHQKHKLTTIAQVAHELEWSPVQGKLVEVSNHLELSSTLGDKLKTLPINQGRSSLTDQELGALSEQFLNNLEEQIDRTLCLTTTVTATAPKKHSGEDEDGGGASPRTTPGCFTNAQELGASRASQDIMARRALLCQSNKMELQLDLFQSLATHLLEIRTKVTHMENFLATTRKKAQCSCSPILDKLCSLLNILSELVESVKEKARNDKTTVITFPPQRCQSAQPALVQGQNIPIPRANPSSPFHSAPGVDSPNPSRDTKPCMCEKSESKAEAVTTIVGETTLACNSPAKFTQVSPTTLTRRERKKQKKQARKHRCQMRSAKRHKINIAPEASESSSTVKLFPIFHACTSQIAQQQDHAVEPISAPQCREGKSTPWAQTLIPATSWTPPPAQSQEQPVASIMLAPRDHDVAEATGLRSTSVNSKSSAAVVFGSPGAQTSSEDHRTQDPRARSNSILVRTTTACSSEEGIREPSTQNSIPDNRQVLQTGTRGVLQPQHIETSGTIGFAGDR